jgi:hypothetical protein
MIVKFIDVIRSCRTEQQLETAAAWIAELVVGEDNLRLVNEEVSKKMFQFEMQWFIHDAEQAEIRKQIEEIPW